MRLQLNTQKAKSLAALCESFSGEIFRDTQNVLKCFKDQSHDPFTYRDVKAVLEQIGWDLDKDNGWNVVQGEIRNCCTSVPEKRGYYTQKTQGPKTEDSSSKTEDSSSKTEDSSSKTEDSGIQTVAEEGLSWSPPASREPSENEGWYADDDGLRESAITQTKCFGSFLQENEACVKCPLARFCVRALPSVIEQIAQNLDEETEKALRAAEEERRQKALQKETPSKKEAPTLKKEPSKKDDEWPVGFRPVQSLPFDGVCSGCDKEIKKGSRTVYVSPNSKVSSGNGMYHVKCARKLIG